MYFKKLVGNNIYLSPISVEDVQNYTNWLNDFETTDYIGQSTKIYSIEKEKKFLEKFTEENNDVNLGIVTLKEDKLIGNCGLKNVDYINRVATLGIFIGDKKERSKGYGKETIKLLLDFGFNYLNLNEINLDVMEFNKNLDVMEFNKRAIKCYEKVGFKEYGRRRKCVYINGKYYDKISMDILKSEFEESFIKNKNI